jgi:hypothetical protein
MQQKKQIAQQSVNIHQNKTVFLYLPQSLRRTVRGLLCLFLFFSSITAKKRFVKRFILVILYLAFLSYVWYHNHERYTKSV